MNTTEELNLFYSEQLIWNTVIYVIVSCVGVLANMLVLFVYTFRITDNKGTRYFISILAFIDALGCVVIGSLTLVDNTRKFSFPGKGTCQFLTTALAFTGGYSAHVILVIALQRYRMICKPFGRQMTLFWRRAALLIILLVCTVESVPATVLLEANGKPTWIYNQNITATECKFNSEMKTGVFIYLGMYLILVVSNMIITILLYVPVVRKVSKMNFRRSKSTSQGKSSVQTNRTEETDVEDFSMATISGEKEVNTKTQKSVETSREISETSREISENNKEKTRITQMFLVIIIIYVSSYIPLFIVHTFEVTGHTPTFPSLSYTVSDLFTFSTIGNHVSNPFVYMYYDRTFRSKLRCV